MPYVNPAPDPRPPGEIATTPDGTAIESGGSTAPRRRGRGRRPAPEVRADVLGAARRILFADGMGAFTIERVAAEAAVSKTTIYKWWPTKGALAFETYFQATEPQLAFPDTGDVVADLRTQLHSHVRLIADSPAGRALAGLVAEAQTDSELADQMHERYTGPRRRLAVTRMRRAQQDGQLRPDIDPEVIVDQLWGAVYHRLLFTGLPITPEFVDQALDNLLNSVRPGTTPALPAAP